MKHAHLVRFTVPVEVSIAVDAESADEALRLAKEVFRQDPQKTIRGTGELAPTYVSNECFTTKIEAP